MSQYIFSFTWVQFCLILGVISIVYVLLSLFLKLPWIKHTFNTDNILSRFLKFLYWPLASVFVAGLLLMKNPIFYGFIVLITLILSWKYIKEIFLGAFLKFGHVYRKNGDYHIKELRGTLISMDLIGVRMKINKGTQFFTYSQLLECFPIAIVNDVASDELNFKCQNNGSDKFNVLHIQNLLFKCPYVDHYYKPKINVIGADMISVKMSTRNQISIDSLLSYLAEKEPQINFKISNNTF